MIEIKDTNYLRIAHILKGEKMEKGQYFKRGLFVQK